MLKVDVRSERSGPTTYHDVGAETYQYRVTSIASLRIITRVTFAVFPRHETFFALLVLIIMMMITGHINCPRGQ